MLWNDKAPTARVLTSAFSRLGYWLSEIICLQKSPAWCTFTIYCPIVYIYIDEEKYSVQEPYLSFA